MGLDELLAENKHSDEKMKKAQMDAAKLADDLRVEHDHYQAYYKGYKKLEADYKDLYAKYEENYANISKSGKDAYAKMELKVKELENSLSDETNKYADCMKNYDKMEELVDKLQVKIKTYKKQIEEAEEIAALNLAKYRKVQQNYETKEEYYSVTQVQKRIHND